MKQLLKTLFSFIATIDYTKEIYPSKPKAKPKHNLGKTHIFSKRSKRNLENVHPDLVRLAYQVLKKKDHTILEGYRGETRQNHLFRINRSQLKFPKSRHNKNPSLAIDVAPFPIDWNNTKRFKDLGRVYKREAEKMGIKITWGGDWRAFQDLPHIQLETK